MSADNSEPNEEKDAFESLAPLLIMLYGQKNTKTFLLNGLIKPWYLDGCILKHINNITYLICGSLYQSL